MLLLASLSLALAAGPWCGTGPMAPVERTLPTFQSAGPVDRDAVYNVGGTAASTHFQLKWGPDLSVDAETASQLALDFETAYATYLGDGYPAVFGADTYRLDVYLTGTGLCWDPDCADPVEMFEGAAAAAAIDPEGWPVILMTPELIDPSDPLIWGWVGAHELFHVFQADIGTWREPTPDTNAWREMTATWAAAWVYPDYLRSYEFVYAFALLPQYPLDRSEPDGPLTPLITRPYGAMVFPLFLTERFDASVVRQAWLSRGSSTTPFERVDEVLGDDWGTSLPDLLPDFALANLTWDYEHGDLISAELDQVLESIYADPLWEEFTAQLPEERYALHLQGATGGPVRPDAELAPRRWGVNYVRLDGPGDWQVNVSPDALGSAGTRSELVVWTAVVDEAGQAHVLPACLELATALTLEEGEHAVWGITATPATAQEDETFSYQIDIQPTPAGGGCSAAPGLPSAVVALLALVVVRVRRSGGPARPSYRGCSLTAR